MAVVFMAANKTLFAGEKQVAMTESFTSKT